VIYHGVAHAKHPKEDHHDVAHAKHPKEVLGGGENEVSSG
jgi:hypothetical protein